MPEPGMPSIAQQLANTRQLMEAHPKYYCEMMSAIAPTFAEAYAEAYFHCLSFLIDNTCKHYITGVASSYSPDDPLYVQTTKRTVDVNLVLQYTMTSSEQYVPETVESKEDTRFLLEYSSSTNVDNLDGHLNSTSESKAAARFTNKIDAIKLQSLYRVLKDGNVEVMLLLAREIRESVLDRHIYD